MLKPNLTIQDDTIRHLVMRLRKIRYRRILYGCCWNPNIDPVSVIELVQSTPKVYRFDGKDVLRFSANLETPNKRIGFVGDLLMRREHPGSVNER